MQHRRPANKGLISPRSPQERDRLHRGVVLIPGFMDTPGLFRRMGRALEAAGHDKAVFALCPSSGARGMDELAADLGGFVNERFAGRRLAIVGFSLGGIVARYWVQRLGGLARTDRLIALATPHRGTATAPRRVLARCLPARPTMNPRRLLAAALGAAAGAAAYATFVEPRWVQLRRSRIHLRALPSVLEGLRIGLLSDLHVTDARSAEVAARAAELVVGAEPDLIALTGDFAEHEAGLRRVLEALRPLRAPLGVFAVPGNHDHVAGIETWHALVERAPHFRDLTNRYDILEHRGARICVGGVDDIYEGSPRLHLPPPESRDLTILLAHSPDQAEHCRRSYDAVDLVVSGHTHGGQVRLPFLPAPINSAVHRDLYEEGLRRRPWTQVYTSRGVGTSGVPFRFFSRPEATLLTLTRAPRPRR